jgi:hypothetical protein
MPGRLEETQEKAQDSRSPGRDLKPENPRNPEYFPVGIPVRIV